MAVGASTGARGSAASMSMGRAASLRVDARTGRATEAGGATLRGRFGSRAPPPSPDKFFLRPAAGPGAGASGNFSTWLAATRWEKPASRTRMSLVKQVHCFIQASMA